MKPKRRLHILKVATRSNVFAAHESIIFSNNETISSATSILSNVPKFLAQFFSMTEIYNTKTMINKNKLLLGATPNLKYQPPRFHQKW
jgi:hypothetical protein